MRMYYITEAEIDALERNRIKQRTVLGLLLFFIFLSLSVITLVIVGMFVKEIPTFTTKSLAKYFFIEAVLLFVVGKAAHSIMKWVDKIDDELQRLSFIKQGDGRR